MKCKSDFGCPVQHTFAGIQAGELFRFINGSEPLLRNSSDRFSSLLDGGQRVGCSDWKIVRIRIDRVEDGIPVFVDA
jgi:hypothetical protein